MTVTALVQRMNQNRYRAATTHPVALEVEAASREEALSDLRALASGWLADTEVVELDLPEHGSLRANLLCHHSCINTVDARNPFTL